jgi:hypothetical protein
MVDAIQMERNHVLLIDKVIETVSARASWTHAQRMSLRYGNMFDASTSEFDGGDVELLSKAIKWHNREVEAKDHMMSCTGQLLDLLDELVYGRQPEVLP